MSAAIRRILIIRISSIGDIVMAGTLLKPIKNAFPHADIIWLSAPPMVELLQCQPQIDNVMIWRRKEWIRLIKTRNIFGLIPKLTGEIRKFRNAKIDLVIDAQGLLKTRIITWLTRAPRRIGLASKEPGRCFMTNMVSWNRDDPRYASEYRKLLDSLRLQSHFKSPYLSTCQNGFKKISREHDISGSYVILCPFTTRPQKHWIESRWARLAERLHRKSRLPSLILGGPDDVTSADQIIQRTNTPIRHMAGKTTLAESAALVRQAALVIGVDTGITHMGIAHGRPTIALFGSTRPYLHAYTNDLEVIYHHFPCSPCHRRPTCNDGFDCMKSITVPRVMKRAKRLLRFGAAP